MNTKWIEEMENSKTYRACQIAHWGFAAAFVIAVFLLAFS